MSPEKVGETRLRIIYEEDQDLLAAHKSGCGIRTLVHIFEFRPGAADRTALCRPEDLLPGIRATPNQYTTFCENCWKAFMEIRERNRHSELIMSVEGHRIETGWNSAEGCMVIKAEHDHGIQYYHLKETDAVRLVYHLSTMMMNLLEQALATPDGDNGA